MKKIIIAIFAALTLFFTGGVVYSLYIEKPNTTQATGQIQQVKTKYEVGPPTAEELLELVNAERAMVGVAPLKIDENVQKSAQLKVDDMAARNYFQHNVLGTEYTLTPEMAYYVKLSCSSSSENIRWTPLEYSTSQEVYNGWYNSPPHIAAIRNADYTLTGIAIAKDADKYYSVEHFCIAR